ncbi:MAG: hypothetical protein ABR606_15515 [Vicinamibacterales bacterium]
MQRMSPPMRRGLVLFTAALVLSSCRATEDTSPPAATMAASMSRTRVPLGSPVEMTYRFTVAPDASPLGSRRVFVHFLDQDDELMWTDDHEPPTPTTQWAPGQAVEYTRTMFAPVYPYVGQAKVVGGLYASGSNDRVKLAGDDRGDRSYLLQAFELLPQTDNVFLIYKDGWHGAEVAPEDKDLEWQWTKKEATLAFRNPKRDAVLYLQMDNPIAQTGGARQVEVRFGDQVLTSLPVSATDAPVHKVPLAAASVGTGDMVELRLVPDRTFVPALEPGSSSGDTRELGVRVFHAYVLPS